MHVRIALLEKKDVMAQDLLTVEINQDTAIANAACCILEKRHAIRGFLVLGRGLAGQVHEISGVYDGVAKAEDAFVAAA